jgi:hypothetical protein
MQLVHIAVCLLLLLSGASKVFGGSESATVAGLTYVGTINVPGGYYQTNQVQCPAPARFAFLNWRAGSGPDCQVINQGQLGVIGQAQMSGTSWCSFTCWK